VKDVPDKSIAVGVPANIIKRNINIDNVLYHLNKKNVD
jgi:acetyltransferase-like isoleucine patch superfamily enzyme